MHRHVLLGSTCSYKTSALPTHGRLGMCLLLYAARHNPPQLNRQRSKPYACGLKRPHGFLLRWQFCSWSITTQVLSGPNKERSRVLNLQSGRFGGTASWRKRAPRRQWRRIPFGYTMGGRWHGPHGHTILAQAKMTGVLILTPSERLRLVGLLDTTAHYLRDLSILTSQLVPEYVHRRIAAKLNAALQVLLSVRNVISGEYFANYFEGEV